MAGGVGVGSMSGSSWAYKLDGDGNAILGNTDGDTVQITGTLSVKGGVVFNEGSADKDFRVESNNNANMLVVDAGNDRVGIGTGTPAETLHVAGNLEVSGNDPRIKINGVTDSHPGLEFYENGTRKWIIFNNYGDDSLDFKTNSNTRMVIDQDGKVGIGTQSPDYTLDVAGSIGIGDGSDNPKIYHNGDDDTYIRFGNDNINFIVGNRTLFTTEIKSSQPHEVTINDGGNNVDFVVKGNGSNKGNPLFKCDASTGRVGINGVGSPSVELDVDGSANISGQFARGVASVNLGSGTTSTLNPGTSGAGTLLVTASSITTPTGGAANEGMHVCSLADGTIAGQVLTIIIVSNFLTGAGGASDMGVLLIAPNTPLNSSTGIVTFTGSAMGGNPQGSTAVLMWTGSAWAVLSTRRGGGSA